MRYPTLEEVNKASPYQLLKWYRFLPSPGWNYITGDDALDDNNYGFIQDKIEEEAVIMNEIGEQLKQAGGITPALSKQVGW